MISLTVPGEPVAKERPRTVNGHTYTPQKTLDHEEKIRQVWGYTVRKWDPKGRFHVAMQFFVGRDNKDLDNMVKTVLDALNHLAFDDDRQVEMITAHKKKRKPPSTVITILRMDG